jgi:AraC-like DNA-binding protein
MATLTTMTASLLQWGRKSQPYGYQNRYGHYPQCYAICVCSGQLRLERPHHPRVDLHPGTAVFLAPGAPFTLSTPVAAYSGHFVEWPLPSRLAQEKIPPQAVVIPASRPLRATINAIESEYAGAADAEVLTLLYHLAARRIHLAITAMSAVPGGADAAAIQARLRANLQTDATIADILGDDSAQRQARRMLSSAGLPPPKRLLLDLKLDEARRLLRSGHLAVTAVAFELGFPSSQHFATCYRKRFGLAPSDERRAPGLARRTQGAGSRLPREH